MTDSGPNNSSAAVDRSRASATTEMPAASPPDTAPREGPTLTVPEEPLARWFDTIATEYETAVALLGTEGNDSCALDYGELASYARRIAAGLLDRGVDPGDRVLVADLPEPAQTASFLGVQFAGGVFVPPGAPSHRPSDLVDRFEPVCVLEGSEETTGTTAPDAFDTTASLTLTGDRECSLPPTDPDGSVTGYDRSPDDVAAILPTSGTTGDPVAPVLTHQQLLAGAATVARRLRLDEEDALAPVIPSSHVHALVWALACLAQGGTVTRPRIDDLVADLRHVTPTRLVTVPRLYRRLYGIFERLREGSDGVTARLLGWAETVAREYGTAVTSESGAGRRLRVTHALLDRLVFATVRRRLGLHRVEQAVAVGGTVDTELQTVFRGLGVPVLSGYGRTETAGLVALPEPEEPADGTVGTPLAGSTLRLADDGELLVAGPQVMDRYWQDETATRGAIIDGWFHSGDLGQWQDDQLRILDRKRHMATLSDGKPVSPARVECHLRRAPIVADAVAVADDRPHVGALLQPAFETLLAWAERENGSISGVQRDDTGAVTGVDDDVLERPRLRDRFQRAVESANDHLADHETVEVFHVLPRTFRVDEGELTPLLEKRRERILERFQPEIDALYS
jgi:long-chain acyl-CoA synthetase